ncbi:MAG: leucine-rich repeat domain-containing protein, partial [Candidatus Heimdallarchaeota archaeon]|nr:leucine-rich repeat domain-containing protein [Candidatus Heimdallarchaeota archaeon]
PDLTNQWKNGQPRVVLDESKVKLLNLSHLDLKKMPTSLNRENFPALEALYLRDNQISEVNLTIFQYSDQFKVLDLSNNILKEIDLRPIRYIPNLSHLYLEDNGLTDLDLMPLEQCKNLEALYLGGNIFQSLNIEFLFNLSKLIVLDLGENVLSEFNNEQLQLLRNKGIEVFLTLKASMPSEIEEETKSILFREEIEEELLEIDYQKLKDLAEKLELELSEFNTKDWGYDVQLIWGINRKRVIINKRRVIVLNLGWLGPKKIKKVSCDLFPELQGVSFNNNELQEFDINFLRTCEKLEAINLSNNQLKEIDFTPIDRLYNLKEIDLHNNKLSSIDLKPLIKLTKLRKIDVTGNWLTFVELNPISHIPHYKSIVVKD